MIGILTEKPSAKRHFAEALGGVSGTFHGQSYIITSARGHLYKMADPEEQVPSNLAEKYRKWSMAYLPWDETQFQWKKIARDGSRDTLGLIRSIEETLKQCDEIAIATDYDPTGEGDLLAWEIIAKFANEKKITRMIFMDEMPISIQDAFDQRKEIVNRSQDEMYRKAEFRSRWDYLSMQLTRIASECSGFAGVLRQGRLKSPMVQLVGDQLKAVDEYRKIPFYQNRFRDENGNVYVYEDEPMVPVRADVQKIYSASPVVVDLTMDKRTPPPKLYDLAGLSGALAKKYSAKGVLRVYQAMYEKNIVSYPRTEDKTITMEQFRELEAHIDEIAVLAGIDPALLTVRTPRKTHVVDGGAHGANRIGGNLPKSPEQLDQFNLDFGPGAKEIWLLLARRCCQMFMEDYIYTQQTGHLEKYPYFKGKTNIPKYQGWRQLMLKEDQESDEEEKETCKLLGSTAVPFVHEGFPKKPEKPSTKWLMKKLETHDVGTGATRTSVFAEIVDKDYKYPLLAEKRGVLSLTSYGKLSYELAKGSHIGDLKTTEVLQAQMRQVGRGELAMDECLADMKRLVIEDMEVMCANGAPYLKESMEKKQRVKGIWNGREIEISPVWGTHRWTDEELRKLFAGEEVELTDLKSKEGKTYGIAGKIQSTILNGRTVVAFQRTRFLDKDGVPDSWGGYTFSPEERSKLERGERLYFPEFVSKAGKRFTCELEYIYDEEKGKKVIHAIFPEKREGIPNQWCGHTFTILEKQMLENGEAVFLSDCVSSSKKPFSCTVEYKFDNSTTKKIVPQFAGSKSNSYGSTKRRAKR